MIRRFAAIAVLVALVALVYGRTIGYQFVFDDGLLVVNNPQVRLPLAEAHRLLSRAESGTNYRPLRTLSYVIDHGLAGGLDPSVFHASNLVYHALAVLALYGLARCLLRSEIGAFAAAAIFAVHPLNSEAVANVAGRRDLLCGLFVLLALGCWRRWGIAPEVRSGLKRGLGVLGMIVLGLLGAAAKETAFILPALALLVAAAPGGNPGGAQPDARRAEARLPRVARLGLAVLCLAGAGLAFALYGEILAKALDRWAQGPLAPQPALSLAVLGQYLWLAIWPAHLSADYTRFAFELPESALGGGSLAVGLVLLLQLGAGWILLRRTSPAGVGLLWFLLALAPVAQLIAYREIVAEHNAYLPLAGLALVAGAAVAAAGRRAPTLTAGVVVVLLVALSLRTTVRVPDWTNSLTLWSRTVADHPRCIRAQHNLGVTLVEEGRLLEARAALERAYALDGQRRQTLLALGRLSSRLGEDTRARELAARALDQKRDYESLTLLGWSQLNLGDASGAVESFEAAIPLTTDPADAERGLALAQRRRGPT